MPFFPANLNKLQEVLRAFCVAALAVAMAGPTFGQQDKPPQTQDQSQTQSQQATPTPPAQATPTPQSQKAPPADNTNRPPVTSRDRMPQNPRDYDSQDAPNSDSSYGQQYGTQTEAPSAPRQPAGPPPSLLTIPAGTVVVMRLNEGLSSDRNQIGDQFTGVLEQPIVVNGWVVARRGQTVIGQVKSVKKAGRIKGTSQLGVELTDLTLVNGQQAPILTELWRGSGGTSHGADAATIGGATAFGAIIGSAADWGTGAAIGAGAGAVAGIGAVLLTRGRPTMVPREAELAFRLVDPVKVDTSSSQQAFLPATQQDYGRNPEYRPRLRGRYYGAYAPCGYYEPCYAPYFGVYPGFYWWGPGYYGGWHGRRFYRRY